jgi:thiamine biosynthesis lipoprotein
MATVFEVHCVHEDPVYAGQAAREAFDGVDRLESELSRFLSNSDVSRINGLSAGQETRVSPTTMECLQVAWALHDLTGGAFDVSLGTGLGGLELDTRRLRVRSHAPGVRIDLGGIGKGYAVDRVAQLLEEWEVTKALAHGGFSSVLALEAPPGQDGWPLSLSAPGPEARVLARIGARQQALGASGLLKGDHILDPRSGRPVADRRAAWVAVPRGHEGSAGAVADGLSTAFMILSEREIRRICGASPGLRAWLVPAAGAAPVLTIGTGEGGTRRLDPPKTR